MIPTQQERTHRDGFQFQFRFQYGLHSLLARRGVLAMGPVLLLLVGVSGALPAAVTAEVPIAPDRSASQGQAEHTDAGEGAARVESALPASQDWDAEVPLDLETLLRLPESYRSGGERRGGIGRREWQTRFAEARGYLDEKNADLDGLQEKLALLASTGGQWQAGAPGLSGNTDSQHQTLSYKLRQDLRSARIAITDAERGMLELGVQADLASVPDDWRQ